MNRIELQEQVINLRTELKDIISLGEMEQRELNENENSRMVEIRSQIDEIEAQIAEMDKEAENLAKRQINKEIKTNSTMNKFNLFETVRGIANGNLSEEQRAFVNGNSINYRAAIVAGVEGQGQENVPEDKKALDVAIRNASVLSKMGATVFSNAVGDISIPKYAGSNVLWKGEIAEAEDGAGAFSETVLKPKRLTAYVDISKTFLAQDANSAEAILIADLAKAVAEKFDKTVFGDGEGDDNTPAGIFAGAETVDTMTYADVLALEQAVEEKNGTDFIFLANPAKKYELKGTQTANGLQMVFDGNEIDGYKTIVSNSIAGLACIVPSDLAAAVWGLEITVDTTSRAIYNEVRLVVNYLVDAKLRGDRVAVVK